MANDREDAIPILLVEDNEIDVEITKRILDKSGLPIRLLVARDGEEALNLLFGGKPGADRAIRAALPKLILLDLRLPAMDGIDIVRRIKKDPDLCPIPVVMLTGVTGDRSMLECIEAGANMYFIKPMTTGDAVGIIKTVERYWVIIEGLLRKAQRDAA